MLCSQLMSIVCKISTFPIPSWQCEFPLSILNHIYHRICNQINMTGVTSGAETAYPSGAPEFTSGFQWGSCYSIFSFISMFCRQLFVLLYLFFWPLQFVLLRYTDSDYPFGIFKLFLNTFLFNTTTSSRNVHY